MEGQAVETVPSVPSAEARGMGDLTSSKEIPAQLDREFPIDEAVIEGALPRGATFLSVEKYGNSVFTVTGKMSTLEPDGTKRLYFLKVAYGEHGGIMLKGEFESSKEIHRLVPHFIPEPFGYGRYAVKNPATYFYLSKFVNMDVTSAPEPAEFTSKLAELHKISQSPTGKFGFHVTTCDGKMNHIVEWEESWAVFFRKLLLGICKLDLETNGPWPELERATKQVATKVVPRLLGALQAEGRQIKPSIVHGDLWDGNVGINLETGDVVMYDAGSYYAHNEMELGHWRVEFSSHFRSEVYTQHYLRNYPAAEPAKEFDDRNRLYSLKASINYSAGHPGDIMRQTAYNNMCYLCEKYAPIDGIDKYDPQKDPSVTGARIISHQGLICPKQLQKENGSTGNHIE